MTDEVRYERRRRRRRPHHRPSAPAQRRRRAHGRAAAGGRRGLRGRRRARGCSSSPAPATSASARAPTSRPSRPTPARLDDPNGPLGFTRRTPAKPTIAAIGGWCLAGGLELALWCDLRVAAQGSTLGFPERRWGVPLIDGGTQRLPRIVGMGRALDLILTGRLVDTDEALAMGLLTEVVPAGRAPRARPGDGRRARELPAGDDARRPPRRARGLGLPLADGLALEAQAGPEVFADAGGRRGPLRRRRGPRRGRRRRIGLPSTREEHALSYFVTGATGFIGRHLVQELLRNREGEIYVLVREGSRERLEELIESWERRRPRHGRWSATSRRSAWASTQAWIDEHRGTIDHFFHLAAVYDMTADERAQRPRQRDRHAQRGGAGQRARRRASCTTPRRSRSPARTRACSARTCSTRARSCPPPITRRSSTPRRSPARRRPSRGASTGRPSSSATRRPARWTRSTGPTTSSRRSRRRATALPEWFPLVGLELGYTNIVPVDYVAAAMDHIAHQPGLDGQAFHLSAPEVAALGRGAQHVRRARPTRRRW